MLRTCLTIVVVAAISALLVHFDDVRAQRSTPSNVQQTNWVRTVDGWEPSTVLQVKARPAVTPPVHPALIATLQLGLSFFGLLALPTTKTATRKSF